MTRASVGAAGGRTGAGAGARTAFELDRVWSLRAARSTRVSATRGAEHLATLDQILDGPFDFLKLIPERSSFLPWYRGARAGARWRSLMIPSRLATGTGRPLRIAVV